MEKLPPLVSFHSKLSPSSLLIENTWNCWKKDITPSSSQSQNCLEKQGLQQPLSSYHYSQILHEGYREQWRKRFFQRWITTPAIFPIFYPPTIVYGEKISNLYRVLHIFDSLPHTHHITTSHSPKAPPSIFSPEFFNDNPTSKENPSWSRISNTTCHSTWWYF